MGPAGYFIALLGCADGATLCQPVATMPTRYESQEACSAATSAVLADNMDFDFPTIVAECRAARLPASGRVEPSNPETRGGRQG
jgi:hypothetical protein